MGMTPEAKRQLSTTIRALRERLLRDLHAGAGSAYRLSVRAQDAGLPEAARQRRRRLEGWIDEQVRAEAEARVAARRKTGWTEEKTRQERATILAELRKDGLQARFLDEAVKQAASTLVNRLVLLRLLEAPRGDVSGNEDAARLRAPAVVTGGWESAGYRDFRQLAPALVRGDETEGYGFLLRLLFEELATELPGVFGPAGVADLLPVPAATLRSVVEALDDPALAGCWTDDLTLGWVYQYWNDPEREALDVKLNAGEKLEPHEIASKTQMFTERYMVDWLLQNSLGPMWLAICRKHGWTADCEAGALAVASVIVDPVGAHRDAPGVDGGAAGASAGAPLLDRLEARRVAWRAARDLRQRELEALHERQARGIDLGVTEESLPGVSLTELMPLHTEAERRWACYVPQPIPEDAVKQAPDSVRDLRILDPAVGSGHFLVVAFDLLSALYHEEARHRGEAGSQAPAGESAGRWSEKAIAERILEHNLHGVDLDPRAVQIAAASLWLKARQSCPEARPRRLNLVASDLSLSGLPDEDPALEELRREVARETGIPAALTDAVVHALQGADHLGSLLKVDAAVDEALRQHEAELARTAPSQGDLWAGFAEARQIAIPAEQARATVLERLEGFLARHTGGEDLGLRLRGEQLAAGVRFVRMLREGTYDLVVGNPPYQGTSKMADAAYVKKHYPRGKADLYAAFLERGLQLAREGGTSALLTMRNWMFIKQYAELRTWLLETYDLRALGDFDRGAFEDVPDEVVSVVVSVFRKAALNQEQSVALQPTPTDDRTRDSERTRRKRAAVRCQVGRHQFDPQALKAVPEWPVVYWWSDSFVQRYRQAPLLGISAPVRQGMKTCNNTRFVVKPWEVVWPRYRSQGNIQFSEWIPCVMGAAGKSWFEPLDHALRWKAFGLELKSFSEYLYITYTRTITNEEYYFRIGIAFSMIGNSFSARKHRFEGAFGGKGSSVFTNSVADTLCQMNSQSARFVLQSLNPGIGFEVGDVNRLPLFPIESAEEIFGTIEKSFTEHESHREPSVEFVKPGPSAWQYAQEWAQTAVDRSEEAPLPAYEPVYDPEPATDHLSFALGVALGRFAPAVAGEPRLNPDARRSRIAGIVSCPSTRPAAQPWAVHEPPLQERRLDLKPCSRSGQDGISGGNETRPRPDVRVGAVREPPQDAGSNPLEPWGVAPAVASEPELNTQAQTAGQRATDASGCERPERNVTRKDLTENEKPDAKTSAILDPQKDDLSHALPAGLLFLDGTLETTDLRDGLGHPAARPLLDAWKTHGPDVRPGAGLREYLRTDFFPDVHRQMYENRPIHWPLSSEKKTFVAWINIHRWTAQTLRLLLADHLRPALTRLEGELNDLRAAQQLADKKAARAAEKLYPKAQKARDELAAFAASVEQCAEHGPPPPDPRCPPRETDARYDPDLDDGVMVNSAALWPLLAPQWKDPVKWWNTLCAAKGRKDYDWSHLAMRYWPSRVDLKCQKDPSLGVAHGCFWRYHPARAWAWELRLQDEIGPDFRIVEGFYRGDGGDPEHRAAWLAGPASEALDAPAPEALEAIEKEALRRRRKHKRPQSELRLLEAGLWTAAPSLCWELELRLGEKQGLEFRLLAPDEPAARAAFEAANPERTAARRQLLAQLRPAALVEEEGDEAELSGEDEDAEEPNAGNED